MNGSESTDHAMNVAPGTATDSARPSFRDMATEAMRYWEPRRLVYNGVLAAIVMGYFVAYWPDSRSVITFNSILILFILGVAANGCYCAAYVPDLFAQYSGFRPLWLKWRGFLFAIGVVLAAIFTRFICLGVFETVAASGNKAATIVN